MNVVVQIACTGDTPSAADVAAWAESALAGDDRALCIRVVDAAEGAELNGRFRGRTDPTNVLAFPAGESNLLGDIAICAPIASEEAREQGKRLADHFAHLVIHGVLHLKGLDHQTEADAVAMEAQETRLLQSLGIADPYLEQPPLLHVTHPAP
ncbi:MAG: rRNA maturation RNase YbeY [Gammaproteobacteria bacterium]|nr:rRNA maturation RNase YbeY [Gammaproteobacteria bacterium]